MKKNTHKGRVGYQTHAAASIDPSRILRNSRNLSAEINTLSDGSRKLLPTPIWESLFRITHLCPTFEVVVAVQKDGGKFSGWALKKRDADDVNWPGLFHAPGTVLRHHDSLQSVRQRLDLEIFGKAAVSHFQELPCVVRPDPIRDVTCLSVVYLLSIAEDKISTLSGIWRMFTHDEILAGDASTVVDQIPLYTRAYEHIADHLELN